MTENRHFIALRDIIERGFNQNDPSVANQYFSEYVVEHEYLAPVSGTGPDNMRGAIAETREAIGDLSVIIEELVEAGGKVWMRTRCTGVERKSGKPFSMMGIDIYRFDDGKIIEHWGVPDRYAMMHQVGLLDL